MTAQERAEQQIDDAFKQVGMARSARRVLLHRLKHAADGLSPEEFDEWLDEIFPAAGEIETGVADLVATLRKLTRSN